MPSPLPCWKWRRARSAAGDSMRIDAIGFVEVVGLVAAIAAADAMVKAARVRLLKQHIISPGWVTVVVEGDLASCKAAVDAGKAAAARLGRVISTLVLGRPDLDTEGLVLDQLRPEPEVPLQRCSSPHIARKVATAAQSLPPAVIVAPPQPVAVTAPELPPQPAVEADSTPMIVVGPAPAKVQPSPPEAPQLSGLEAALKAILEVPQPLALPTVDVPPAETLFAYVAAVMRGRTCQEVARRFHLGPAAAREILEKCVAEGRLDKAGSRYLVAQRLI